MTISFTSAVGSTSSGALPIAPVTISITALTASTKYSVQITDPGGGLHSDVLTSTVSGTLTDVYTPTTAGTLSVTVYPVTDLATTTSTPPLSTYPAQRPPATLNGTSALSATTFQVISGQ